MSKREPEAKALAEAVDGFSKAAAGQLGSATRPAAQPSLWQEVDIAFAPLSDAVDAASNVLEEFGELAGDPERSGCHHRPKAARGP